MKAFTALFSSGELMGKTRSSLEFPQPIRECSSVNARSDKSSAMHSSELTPAPGSAPFWGPAPSTCQGKDLPVPVPSQVEPGQAQALLEHFRTQLCETRGSAGMEQQRNTRKVGVLWVLFPSTLKTSARNRAGMLLLPQEVIPRCFWFAPQ